MTDRQLGILAAVAAVLLIVTIVLYSGEPAPEMDFEPGAPLIQGLSPENIGKITITKGDEAVTLTRERNQFFVEQKEKYPAATKEVNELLMNVLDIRCDEKVTEDEGNFADLQVAEDAEEATTIKFINLKGELLIGFVKGKPTERGAGSYVRLLGRDEVYATAEWLSIPTTPMSFIDTKLIDKERSDIQRVTVKTGKQSYTIVRNKEGTVKLQGVPKGKQPKGTEYKEVFGAIAGLSFSDVRPIRDIELKWEVTHVAELKTGLTFTLKLARKDDKHYMAAVATPPNIDDVTITRSESDEKLKEKEKLLQAVDYAKEFNARHAQWVYQLSEWTAKKLRKPLSELIEDIPKPEEAKAPDEIGARHILISYKGAERSEATRTKAEAKKLAEEVLKKVKAKDADFAALAKEYSDGPSAKRGGDLETFKKGVMAPPFEDAAWKLKVGQISGIVETPFGFHIIKRTK